MGYTGGEQGSPTYTAIGDHSEAFQLDFDPRQISYVKLLELVWEGHVATQRATSKQYQPAIFFHDDAQKEQAEKSRAARAAKLELAVDAIITPILPATTFTLAEDYHQKYSLQNEPTLAADLRRHYPTAKELIASTAAARVNGYLAFKGSKEQLLEEIDTLGLSAAGRAKLLEKRGL